MDGSFVDCAYPREGEGGLYVVVCRGGTGKWGFTALGIGTGKQARWVGSDLVIGTCPVNYWAFRRPVVRIRFPEMRWVGLDWSSHWCSERVTRRESDVLVSYLGGYGIGKGLFLGQGTYFGFWYHIVHGDLDLWYTWAS